MTELANRLVTRHRGPLRLGALDCVCAQGADLGGHHPSDPWLEACVYACARLLSMAMHAYARLHPNTPHACVRLGSGTQRWTSCVSCTGSLQKKKLVLVEFLFKSTVCREGT